MVKRIGLGFGSNLGSGSQPCDLLNLWAEFVSISRSWRKNCSSNCSSSLPISVARLITGHISTPDTIYPPTPKPSDFCFHHNYLLCFTLSSQHVHHTFFHSLFIPWSFLFQTPNWLQWRSCLSPLCLTPAVTPTFAENKLLKIIICIFYLAFKGKRSLTSLLVHGLSMPPQTSSFLIIHVEL